MIFLYYDDWFTQEAGASGDVGGVHGKGSRRKREYVEIDGQYFEVADQAEAIRILQQLQQVAVEDAPKAVIVAAKPAKQAAQPTIKISAGLDNKAMRASLAQTQAYIAAIYQQAQEVYAQQAREAAQMEAARLDAELQDILVAVDEFDSQALLALFKERRN